MIAEFFASFGLFWETYLASISASIVLSVAGIFAVTRGQVFLPAALGQASLLGIAVALRLEWEMFALIAVVFSVLAAAFIAIPAGHRHVRLSRHPSLVAPQLVEA